MRIVGITLAMLLSFLLSPIMSGIAAPDPSTVKKEKDSAPLHIIGKVKEDILVEDTTKDEQYPQQIRKMTISVQKVLKAPEDVKEENSLEVYYHYIPSWQAHDYAGSSSVNVAVDDVIEIWLDYGESGWEPAFFGHTVEHIQYGENREEAIAEPFLHKLDRISSEALHENSSYIVLAAMIAILLLIIFRGSNRKA